MKAVYLTAPGRFALRDIPEPELQEPSDVLLRMQAVGVCGSDLHYFRTGRIGNQVLVDPWIMGHECTATVVAAGAEVHGLPPCVLSCTVMLPSSFQMTVLACISIGLWCS